MKTIIALTILLKFSFFGRGKNCYLKFLPSKYLYFLAHIKFFHIFDHLMLFENSVFTKINCEINSCEIRIPYLFYPRNYIPAKCLGSVETNSL